MTKERRLITAALPYTNNVPHIGNIVGSHLPADIFARYCRLQGYETLLIGGTDEHGTASEIAAQQLGVSCQELCDFFYKIHKEIYDWFNISYDNFSRTSKKVHHNTVQEFFKEMYKNKYLIEKTIKVPFCQHCLRSLADRYIVGKCPNCGYESARGDQCEKCSSLLEPTSLINPKCAVCNQNTIIFKEVKHLFLDLEKLSPKLESWIKKQTHWRKQVSSIALSWIKEGLKSRDVTRELNWGISVPIKGYEALKIYVWAEAAIGYISSTKECTKDWELYWKNKDSKIYHFIGKDNIPFHTLLFPGELIAEGSFNLPYNVVGLQYLNYEGSKFSKSKSHGVFCENLKNTGLSSDYWRFYDSLVIPETGDTDFIWNDFRDWINNDLISNFSNYINRTLSFTYKTYGSEIKGKVDEKFHKQVSEQVDKIISLYEKVELREALREILKLSDIGNKYFQSKEPWKSKDKDVLFNCINLIKILGLISQPYLPETSKKILSFLNCNEKDWSKIKEFNITKISEPKILFEKIDDKKLESLKQITSKVTEYRIKTNNPKPTQRGESKLVKYEDFKKIDLKVGEILEAKPHPNADKLMVLKIDLGEENPRTIVAGIKNYYNPKAIIGQKVIVVANLEPIKLRGIESNGMILASLDKENLSLLTTDKEVSNGSSVS